MTKMSGSATWSVEPGNTTIVVVSSSSIAGPSTHVPGLEGRA